MSNTNEKNSNRRPPHPPAPRPPKPPKPHPPKPPKIESKDIILTKKLNHVLYELIVKTRAYMVYVDEDGKSDKVTLTERLSDIADALLTINEKHDTLENAFSELMADAPETFNTLKEIWDYVNVNGDPKSELIQLIDNKVDKEEGKGLSTHDLTDVLYEKLTNDYTKEELDEKFEIIDRKFDEEHECIVNSIEELQQAFDQKISEVINDTEEHFAQITERVEFLEQQNNMIVSSNVPENIKDYDTWYQLVSEDE